MRPNDAKVVQNVAKVVQNVAFFVQNGAIKSILNIKPQISKMRNPDESGWPILFSGWKPELRFDWV
jgi:hypothetical protein